MGKIYTHITTKRMWLSKLTTNIWADSWRMAAAEGWKSIATVRHQYQMTGTLWNETDLHTQHKSPLDKRARRYSEFAVTQDRETHCSTTPLMIPSSAAFSESWMLDFAVFKFWLCQWQCDPLPILPSTQSQQMSCLTDTFWHPKSWAVLDQGRLVTQPVNYSMGLSMMLTPSLKEKKGQNPVTILSTTLEAKRWAIDWYIGSTALFNER